MKIQQNPKPIWKEIELGEILEYEQPTKYIVESTNYKGEYKTPVLTAGKSFILGNTNETEGIYDKLPVIIFDDFTTENKFVNFKFKVKSSAIKLLTPKNDLIDLKYIFLVMQKINFDRQRHKRYYLSAYQYLKIPLPYTPEGKPDLATQKQIVAVLEKAEELKQKQKRQLEIYDEYLKSVFWEMFLKEKGKWEEVELGKIAPLQGGFAFKSKDYIDKGIKLVKINNIWEDVLTWEEIDYLPEEYLKKYDDFSLNENDLVLSMTRPIIKSLNSVKIAQIKREDLPCLLNQRVGRFKINSKEINQKYLLYYCYSNDFKREIEKYSSTSLQPNVSSNQVNKIKIPLPPLELQQKFASIVEKVEKLKEKQKKSLADSEELFNALMQKAFKGELE